MPYALPEHGAPLGLFTDLYELRMAQTYLANGMTAPATFTLYVRPTVVRPWLLTAGNGHALDVVERFRFGAAEIDYLATVPGISDDFLGWLAELEPQGEIVAVPDGTVVLGDEPLLEVTAPLPVAQLLETVLMNVAHYPTLIATKAARCVVAADGRDLAEFGARRAHDVEAAVEASRAAYLAGFSSTSNVEAGRRFGIPVVGTMAHSYVQAFEDEHRAFLAFGRENPGHVTLLVDTYDTLSGVRNAIEAGRDLLIEDIPFRSVRLDSGDLAALARGARKLLDEAGFEHTRIMASGGLDEAGIERLVRDDAPIDAFGIGTSLTTSRDHPAVDIAYKLVEYDGVPTAKYATGKGLLPGAKQVYRCGATPADDVLGTRDDDVDGQPLLRPVWRDGRHLESASLSEARDRAAEQLRALPQEWRSAAEPDEPPVPAVSPALRRLAERTRARLLGEGGGGHPTG